MKIKDLAIGQVAVIPMVIKSAELRKTKTGKPYLSCEFFDGVDTIPGNFWDWISTDVPARNMVFNVSAQVTEYNGAKQLNVKKLDPNMEIHISEFTPSSGLDIGEIYKNAYDLMSEVQNDILRTVAIALLEDLRYAWTTVPGARGIHHAFSAGTLIHSYSVARLSNVLAKNIEGANVDLATVGGMLHDIGKLFTYKIDGITIDMTDDGMMFDHTFIGANFLLNFGDTTFTYDNNPRAEDTMKLLVQIVLSHHGKLEHGAVVTPQCIEAHIVHHADALDANSQMINEAAGKVGYGQWTDKIWALDNRPAIQPLYVDLLLQNDASTATLQDEE